MQTNYAGKAAFEKKFMDVPGYFTAAQTGLLQQSFFGGIIQGNSPITRIGAKITVTNINIHGYVSAGKLNSAGYSVDECPMFRIIVGIDKQCNGLGLANGAADVLSLLYGPTQAADLAGNAFAFRNMYNLDRFVILKDKMISSRASGVGTTSAAKMDVTVPFKFSWKGLLPVHYKSATASPGALVDVSSNNLFILVLSDKAETVSNDAAGVYTMTRVKYIDA